jgi:hypothetical protein
MRVHGTKLGAISTGRGLGDQLYDLAGQVPPLDLNFAGTKTLDPRVTHTRASSATFVDSTGVLRSAVTNLLLRSEEFDDASWNKTGLRAFASGSVANAIAAPNGSVTADFLAEDTSAGEHSTEQTFTAVSGTSYTFSVFIKPSANKTSVRMRYTSTVFGGITNQIQVVFATGTVTATTGTPTGTATPFPNGWWRISMTGTATANGSPAARIQFCQNNSTSPSYTGDGTSGYYIWGAQLEQSATVGDYVPTTSTINSAPRFDHNPQTGESLGLLVEEQRTNLLLRSEEFDDAAWTPIGLLAFGSGSTANAIASPNGQITADLLTESTTTGTHQVQQTASVTIGQVYTYSVFCKLGPNAVRRIQLLVTNANFTVTPIATFDLTTGTVVSVVQGTASITSYANGWYRLALNTIAATSTGVNGFHFRLVDTGTNNSYTGDGSAGLYLWGAQLEAGAFPTSYIPTTSATVTRAADVASITGANFGVTRTNLALNSEDFSAATWTLGAVTVTANAAVSPTGATTADLLLETTANTEHILYATATYTFTTATQSIYVKPNGRTNVALRFYYGINDWVARVFSLTGSGSVTQSSAGSSSGFSAVSSSIVDAGNGWYRISMTATQASRLVYVSSPDLCTSSTPTLAASNGTEVYAGDVTKGVYVWGAQLETGPTATAYIPTTAAAVSVFESSWYRQDEGTVFADYEAGPGVASRRTLSINDATANNVIQLITSNSPGSASNYSEIATLGVSQGTLGTGTAYAPGRQTSALAYVVNNVGFAKNGGAASVDLTVSIPTVTRLEIGSNLSATLLNGHIRRLTFWPTRLGNEVLQRITQ